MIACLHDGFTQASARDADRARQLTLAARLMADGCVVDPRWVRVQLLDLRDILRAVGRD